MATLTELPVSELKAQAREAPGPARVLVTAIAGFFFAIGWIIGGAWRGAAFCAVSARYGYWQGRGFTDDQIAAKITAKRQPAQPAQPPNPRA